jgi:hypothetical protein
MKNKPPIIHIGYHKTGTSYLQRNIFERFDDVFNRISQSKIRNTLILPSPLRYSEKAFTELISGSDKRIVVSNEFLSSGIHADDYRSKTNADRLKSAIPNAKIIIGIREQVSILKSAYNQYLRAKGSYSIKEYLVRPLTGSFNFSHLQYHFLINYYIDLYGKENVFVLPYELLKKDPKAYVDGILKFIDEEYLINNINFSLNEKINPSLKPCVLNLKKYFNPFILKRFSNIGGTLHSNFLNIVFRFFKKILTVLPTNRIDNKIKNKIHKEILKQTEGFYEQSNNELNKLTDFNLKEFGYRL